MDLSDHRIDQSQHPKPEPQPEQQALETGPATSQELAEPQTAPTTPFQPGNTEVFLASDPGRTFRRSETNPNAGGYYLGGKRYL
jgi:hypothetical protein